MRHTILVVDDEQIITDSLVAILNREPGEFLAIGCCSAGEAVALVHGIRPDLVLLDVMMPGVHGLEHALEMRDQCQCRVLLMSGQLATADLLDEIKQRGHKPFEIIAKPMHPEELLQKIRVMLASS